MEFWPLWVQYAVLATLIAIIGLKHFQKVYGILQNCNVDFNPSQDYAYDKRLSADPLNDFTKQGQTR